MREIPTPPSWFEINKYAPARSFGFRDWATHIGNRFLLGAQLTHGKLDEFDQFFSRIQANPFDDLGYRGSYPSDNTVFPLTFGVAKTFTKVLAESSCADEDICDKKLRELHPDMYAGQAHLFVNLHAPKALLVKQFRHWLDENLLERKRGPAISSSVIQTWAVVNPILPYQDLKLWHKRHGQDLSQGSVMADWLDVPFTDREIIRKIGDKAEWIFTDDCYFDLILSASNESPTAD